MSTTRENLPSSVRTVVRGGVDFVQIEIPAAYFEVLRRWASVGRTVDAAVHLLEEAATHAENGVVLHDPDRFVEQANYTVQELLVLKQPLSAAGSACLQKYVASEVAAAKSRVQARLVIGEGVAFYFETEQQAGFAYGIFLGQGIQPDNPITFSDRGRFRVGFKVPISSFMKIVDVVNDRMSELYDVAVVSAAETWWE